jgi:hypothetical protein
MVGSKPQVEPGATVAERFRVESLAGAGGMASVFSALDTQTGARVALKLLAPAQDEARFEDEAQLLSRLHHPAIVRYVAHGRTEDRLPWLALEWVEGESLSTLLRRERPSVDESIAIALRVAEGLSYAHALGVVHRDVKPANLMIARRPGGARELQVKLLDFGIARGALEREAVTQVGAVVGTVGYMAPEQLLGTAGAPPRADARSDLFALGCVLFECLTGQRAFPGETLLATVGRVVFDEPSFPIEHEGRVPPALMSLVVRLLAKDPAARPQSAREVEEELSRIATGGAEASGEEPSARGRVGLGTREQQVVSVLLAFGDGAPDEGSAAWHTGPRDAAELARASDERARRQAIAAAVEPFGARLEWAASGTLLALLTSAAANTTNAAGTTSAAGGAKEQALRVARCAQALLAMRPGAPIVLATGLSESSGRTPVGAVVDRAARLFAAHARGARRIVVDGATAALLAERWELGALDGDEDARALLEERLPDALTPQSTLLGRAMPFVGRARELSTLVALYAEVASESVARAAIVVAPAGAGKSRLGRELVRALRDHETPPAVWFASTDPLSASTPLGPIARAVRLVSGAKTTRALRDFVARHVAPDEVARVAELLGALAELPREEAPSPLLRAALHDKGLWNDQIERAWLDLVRGATTHAPLALVLEDVHWADPGTLRLIDATLGALPTRPLLVIATARPEVSEAHPALFATRAPLTLHLPELSRRAAETLVRSALGDAAGDTLVERIVARAAGNPFFLEELVRAAAEGRAEALPDSVLATLELRLRELPTEARLALRAGSVFGETFQRRAAQHLLDDRAAASLDASLALLVERELIVRRRGAGGAGGADDGGEGELGFRHALVRDAAYATLTPDDRRLGHRLAGEWLEARGERSAILLATHFDQGGARERAARWYVEAARQAYLSDPRLILQAAERGIAAGAADEMLGELEARAGEALLVFGDFPGALRRMEAGVALLPPGCDAWIRAVGITIGFTPDEPLRDRYVDAMLAAEPWPDAHGIYATMAMSNIFWMLHVGRPDRAAAFLARLSAVHERDPDDWSVRGMHGLGAAFEARLLHGDPWRASIAALRARDAFSEVGYGAADPYSRAELARALATTGEAAAASTLVEEALEAVRARHLMLFVPLLAGLASWIAGRDRQPDRARRHAETALTVADAFPAERVFGHAGRVQVARMWLEQGERARAETCAEAVLASATGAQLRAPALAILSQVARARSEVEKARAHAEEAVAIWRAEGAAGYDEPAIFRALVEARLDGGDPEGAIAIAREAEARIEAIAAQAPDLDSRLDFLEEPDRHAIAALAHAG